MREEIKKVLKEPTPASMTLGPLALALSLPLWLFIPVLLIGIGVGLYLVVSMLPFIVGGVVLGLSYWLLKKAGTPEPWNWIIPLGLGLLALLPIFLPEFKGAVLGMTNAGASAMGILGSVTEWIIGPFLWLTALVVLGFLLVFLSAIRKLGLPGALVAAVLGLALGTAIALNAVGLGPAAMEVSALGKQEAVRVLPILLGGAVAGSVLGIACMERR